MVSHCVVFLLIFLFLYYFINIFFVSFQDNTQRGDLSHPVHSDNCILDRASGECNKIPPAYTWRDYRLSYCRVFLNNFVTFTHLAVHCSTLMMSLKVATSSLPIPQKISLHR